jgi:hypothetical protein
MIGLQRQQQAGGWECSDVIPISKFSLKCPDPARVLKLRALARPLLQSENSSTPVVCTGKRHRLHGHTQPLTAVQAAA